MNGSDFLAEFDKEMAGTRRALERVPEDRFSWAPHEKSMTLHKLASHLANVPTWISVTLQTEELDVSGPFEEPAPATTKELVAHFDEACTGARAALAAATQAELAAMWTMKAGDEVFFSMPRGVVLRSFVFNHMIHHRGQLTVYLRLLGVAVPALYGPSADEQ